MDGVWNHPIPHLTNMKFPGQNNSLAVQSREPKTPTQQFPKVFQTQVSFLGRSQNGPANSWGKVCVSHPRIMCINQEYGKKYDKKYGEAKQHLWAGPEPHAQTWFQVSLRAGKPGSETKRPVGLASYLPFILIPTGNWGRVVPMVFRWGWEPGPTPVLN